MNESPSSYQRRVAAAVLACAGFAVALYLGLYQLGRLAGVWDPLFGHQSVLVLHSALAGLLPIPDALLGAGAYLVELVLELSGGEDRWRARPMLTGANMALVLAMGVGSLGLVAAQAFVFHAWCTLCLVSAACSFAIVALSWPEIRAVAWQLRAGQKA